MPRLALPTRFLTVVAVATLVAGGCDTRLQTADEVGNGCQVLRAIEGVLKTDLVRGLGLENRRRFTGVVWPHGYSARRDADGLVSLLDREGRVLAREGDTVAMGGSHRDDGVIYACDPPDLRVVEPALGSNALT